MSGYPIRYSSGEVELSIKELSANGFGWGWGHTRSYSNQLSANFDFGNGFNWIVRQWAYVTDQGGGVVTFVIAPGKSVWFDPDGGGYTARYGALQTLTHNPTTNIFTVSSPDGTRWEFNDFTQTSAPPGLLKRFTTVGNQSIQVTSYTADDRIGQVERSATINGVVVSEAFAYEYYGGTQSGRLSVVTLRRRAGLNPWSDIRRVKYDYYEAGDSCGSLGDLRTATVETPQGTDWAPVNTRYYRYYTDNLGSGFKHGIKFVFSSAAFHRLKKAVGNPFTATDEQAAAYADNYFEYDDQQRAVLERVAAGTRTFSYEYFTSTNPDEPNSWKTRTTETQPDGTQNIVYCNSLGQVMLKVFKQGTNSWLTYRKYGNATDAATGYRVIERAEPSAVVSYNEAFANLAVSLKSNAGLVHLIEYHNGSSGSPIGFPARTSVREGAMGTPIKTNEWQWTSSAVGGQVVYNLSQSTTFKSTASGGSEPIVTGYSYTYHSGSNQVEQKTITLPAVSVGQNGSGVSPTQRVRYDQYGNIVWEQGPKGFIDHFSYDVALGVRVQMIDDVDSSYLAYPAGWSRPADLPAPPLNLITDFTYDPQGRRIQTLGPIHEVDGVATRKASWSVYLETEHEVRRGMGYATGIGPNYSFTLVNPVQITRRNNTERVHDSISAARASTAGRLCAGDTFPQSSWTAWSQTLLNDQDEVAATRAYHTIPTACPGEAGANYDETSYQYDVMGRRVRTHSPGGTITWVTYDVRGQVLQTYVGTSDAGATPSDPTAGGVAGNNLVLVTANEYDDGLAGGNGNLTKVTQYVDSSPSTTARVTSYTYDFRDRQLTIDGEIDLFISQTYDNLDRVVKVQRFNTSAAGTLLAQSETFYDDRGQVFQTKQYAVNPTTGAVGNALVDNFWYDAAGNRIKELPAGSARFTKRSFDGVKRVTAQYVGYYTGSGDEPYVDAGRVTAQNKIFEQTLMTYDGSSDLIQVTSYLRFHDATGNGLLNLPDGAEPRARVTYQANYYDGIGRTVAAANYGTNNNVAFSRPAEIPARSDDVLVSSTAYNDAGSAFRTVDPAGMATRTEFDALGRQTAVIQNDTAGCPGSDTNLTIRFTYTADGKLATLTAVNADTGDQVTNYQYGTTLADSALARSDLLRSVIYPDATDLSDRVTYRYNRQQQTISQTDQNGTLREFDYDKLGRLTADRVLVLGQVPSATNPNVLVPINGNVRRLETTYNSRGLTAAITSLDAASGGSVVNQVVRSYNDFQQLAVEFQSHSAAVNTSSTPAVIYAYADGSANTVRPTSVTYPNGRVVTTSYGAAGSDDDRLSRTSSYVDPGSVTLAAYTYLGLNSVVKVDYPTPKVRYDLATDSGSNPYVGIDRFGRVIDSLWQAYGTSPGAREQVQYGYDRASNRIWRKNTVAPSGKNDELYGYDGVQRLVESARGSFAGGERSHIDDLQFAQDWTLDATGNWNRMVQTDTVTPTKNLDQSRWQNQANEITAITRRYGVEWPTPTYDRNGNMLKVMSGNTGMVYWDTQYDAWNRMVHIGSVDYAYDGLNRRIHTYWGANDRHYYFNADWQLLETRQGSSNLAERQFVWGVRYIDDLILRDRFTSGGSLQDRLFALQDANWNVTTIVDTTGAVAERYRYTAYGAVTFLNAAFQPVSSTDSVKDWETLYAGYYWAWEGGWYLVRNRWLQPLSGIWTIRDPIRYEGNTLNLYEYTFDSPCNSTDPLGLQEFRGPGGMSTPSEPLVVIRSWGHTSYGDCVSACFSQNLTVNAGTAAFHAGNAAMNSTYGRYPRSGLGGQRPYGTGGGRGSPTTWTHRATMNTKWSGAGKACGRGCVILTVAQGFFDIGAEIACLLICADAYPGVDKESILCARN